MVFVAIGSTLTQTGCDALTSGSVNVFRATFEFDATWDGLERTAVFRTSLHNISVFLGAGDTCVVPHEVLDAGFMLSVAVFGVRGDVTVLTTNYVDTGVVQRGADIDAPGGAPPTPGQYAQLLGAVADLRMVLDGITSNGGFATKEELASTLDEAMQAVLQAAQDDIETSVQSALVLAAADAMAKADAAAQDAKNASRPTNWMPTARDVGADPVGSASAAELRACEASIPRAEKGAPGGVAQLNDSGSVPMDSLPSGTEIVETVKNAQVPVGAWMDNTTEGQPPYKAKINALATVNARLSQPTPEVIFGVTDASGGNFVPACDYAAGVLIYAFEKPTATVSIPLVRLRRCVL